MNELEILAKVVYKSLGFFSGMGMAKCSSIIAAMELARRLVDKQMKSANEFFGLFEKRES